MKKVFLFLVVLFCFFGLVGCGGPDTGKDGYDYDAIPDTMEAASYQIAFVTDIGQLKDKSFNQGTWEGLKRFAYENNKTYKYYQPANGNNATDDDRYNAMKAAVDGGAEIVVCAGFMQQVALEKIAKENPTVKFVFVDGWNFGYENVTAVIFQEEQAGYLAGYGAVKDGYTKLGFAGGGGGTNPACQRFGYGFVQGANDAAKELGITVDMKYSWLYGAAFSASPELQTMLEGWYSTGTEVAVIHMMGEPTETRHVVMNNFDAIISPSWSIHSGVGTSNYTFIWAMGGENQEFDDMDTIPTPELR